MCHLIPGLFFADSVFLAVLKLNGFPEFYTVPPASLAGASGGCQAEIGSASGMTAAAICSVRGGSKEQMGHACAMALKNLMGLVCDPVAGLVEVPCVKRNVGGAVNALAAADMALAGIISQIPVDQVIDAMAQACPICSLLPPRKLQIAAAVIPEAEPISA